MSAGVEIDAPLLVQLCALPRNERLDRIRQLGPLVEVVLAMVDAAADLVTAESARAIETTGMVVDLADDSGDGVARARARRARARALSYAGRYEDALVVCLEASDAAMAAGSPIEHGRAQLASMHALGELGRLDEAIATGEHARALFEREGESAFAGRAEINLGIIHQKRDEPEAALECFARAQRLLPDDAMLRGHLDNSRGEALKELNDFQGAEAAYESALRAFEGGGATLTAAIAEGNLADLATREGRLRRALYYFEGARRHLEASGSPAHLARLLAEQAEAKALLGLPADALREYEHALGELERWGLSLEAARARCGMGLVLMRLDRTPEAGTALGAAAIAFEELGHATDRAKVDLARAALALRHDGASAARRLAARALAVLHDRPADAAVARLLLARAALTDGDDAAAEADLAAALVEAERLDLAPLLADILDTRGRLHLRRARLDQAVADLTAAVDQIERVRGSLQADRFRAAFLGDRSGTYGQLVTALLRRSDPAADAAALGVAERAKSRSLLEQARAGLRTASDTASLEDDPVDTSLRDEAARLHAELNALYSRLADARDESGPMSVDGWRGAVRQREAALEEAESRLAASRHAPPAVAPPLDLDELMAELPDDTRLVEYFVADGRILCFVVGPDRLVTHRDLGSIDVVAHHLSRLRFQIDRALRPGAATGRRHDRMVDDTRAELAALHSMLVAPLDVEGVRRMAVIPHDALHLVPFAALWDGRRHLVETHEVHTAPSAGLYAHLGRAGAPVADGPPLVIGVADAVAPRIAAEATLVGSLLGCPAERIRIGDEATTDVVAAYVGNASVVHLACHGRFLRDNPQGSGLCLADRWWTVRDISQTRIRARLVTLSACETGLSTVSAGDELAGMLRSFFAAGAGSILVSLWRVHDETTADFMSSLYRDWPGETSVLERVRHAQLEILHERPHPAFWAPFTLVGRP